MTYIFALAGCLLGFIGLVFGWRAARWALAAILFVPLFLVGDIFLLPLLWEPGGPFVAAAPPAPEPAALIVTPGEFEAYSAQLHAEEQAREAAQASQAAASQPVALPVIPGLKIDDPAVASQPAPAPAATCPANWLNGPLYGSAGVVTYVCMEIDEHTGRKMVDWYWAPLDGGKCLSGYDYFSVSPNATSDLDICLRQAERTDTRYEKSLQALTGENLTPLN